jgi:hypothetical protein
LPEQAARPEGSAILFRWETASPCLLNFFNFFFCSPSFFVFHLDPYSRLRYTTRHMPPSQALTQERGIWDGRQGQPCHLSAASEMKGVGILSSPNSMKILPRLGKVIICPPPTLKPFPRRCAGGLVRGNPAIWEVQQAAIMRRRLAENMRAIRDGLQFRYRLLVEDCLTN